MKIESPSPLQKKIINTMKEEGDILVKASEETRPETGYLVTVLDQIARQDRRQGTKAIILTQKSERAAELDKWIWAAGYHAGIESASIGEDGRKPEQKSVLSAGPVVIVATPARLAELMEENRVVFRETAFLILDRANEFTDWDSVDVISKRIISKCHRMITLTEEGSPDMDRIGSLLNEPQRIGFDEPRRTVAENGDTNKNSISIPKDLTQYYIKVPPRMKISTLMAHLEQTPTDTVLIFTASRRTADRLYRVFRKSGRRAVSLHDGLDKEVFNERFERFNNGSVQHLIAGEISAALLPIIQVTQVINYDVPEDVGEYKLRAELIGEGKATRILSLVSKQDRSDIRGIIEKLGYAPEEIPLPESVKTKKEKKGSSETKRGSRKQPGKADQKQKRGKADSPGNSHSPKRGTAGLPRPSYDKLSRGRSGQKEKEEEAGIIGFFKKLFT
ncbi:MAG: DEAD/DEAH box helicase [Balneolaceae bacterium]